MPADASRPWQPPAPSPWLCAAARDPDYARIAEATLPKGYPAAVDWRRHGSAAAAELIDDSSLPVGIMGRCIAVLQGVPQRHLEMETSDLLALLPPECASTFKDAALQDAHDRGLLLLFALVWVSFTDSPNARDAVGSLLLKLAFGHPNRHRILALRALHCFDRVLALDGSFLPALKGRDTAANYLVNRYHFSMINDRVRNAAFRDAVRRACSRGHRVVVDIGAGSSLLSQYAVEAGASTVHAIEYCPAMAVVCEKCLAAAPKRTQRSVTLRNLLSTQLTRDDFDTPPTLAVTETFDCCLLGEDAVRTVAHAWRELLTHSEGTPRPEVVPATGRLCGCLVESLELSAHMHCKPRRLDGMELPEMLGHDVQYAQPQPSRYFACHVHRLRERPRPLSSPTPLGPTVDFCNPGTLPTGTARHDVHFIATATGTAHAVVVWIELDMGGGHLLHTCPMAGLPGFPPAPESQCWGQACFALTPTAVDAGRSVPAIAEVTPSSLALHFGALEPKWHLVPTCTHDEVRMFNSPGLLGRYLRAAEHFAAAAGGAQWELFEASDMVGPMPAACSARGAARVVAPLLGPSSARAKWAALSCRAPCTFAAGGGTAFLSEPPNGPRRRMLHVPLVSPCGLLNEGAFGRIFDASASCRWDCILPATVDVWCHLVESVELRDRTRVVDENALGPKVADAINFFSSRAESNVDMHSLQHTKLTERIGPLRIFPIPESRGPVAWHTFSVPVLRSGQVHGMPFFFTLGMGASTMDTSDRDLLWNQAVSIPPTPTLVKQGQCVSVTIAVADEVVSISVT